MLKMSGSMLTTQRQLYKDEGEARIEFIDENEKVNPHELVFHKIEEYYAPWWRQS